jgi:hypothetical protein
MDLREIFTKALGARCGLCGVRPQRACVLSDAPDVPHVDRIIEASRLGLITEEEFAAAVKVIVRFSVTPAVPAQRRAA